MKASLKVKSEEYNQQKKILSIFSSLIKHSLKIVRELYKYMTITGDKKHCTKTSLPINN